MDQCVLMLQNNRVGVGGIGGDSVGSADFKLRSVRISAVLSVLVFLELLKADADGSSKLRSRVGTAKRQIRPGAATFVHDLYHAIPFPRVGRKQNPVQAVCELHPKYGFHRAPRTFEYVLRD